MHHRRKPVGVTFPPSDRSYRYHREMEKGGHRLPLLSVQNSIEGLKSAETASPSRILKPVTGLGSLGLVTDNVSRHAYFKLTVVQG